MRPKLHSIRTPTDNSPRKRVLIVNCYFGDSRQPIRRTTKIPQAVGPIYLAGAFSRELCEVRCYTELASGPLEDEKLLSWPAAHQCARFPSFREKYLTMPVSAISRNCVK